jgi:hypothetical protein
MFGSDGAAYSMEKSLWYALDRRLDISRVSVDTVEKRRIDRGPSNPYLIATD